MESVVELFNLFYVNIVKPYYDKNKYSPQAKHRENTYNTRIRLETWLYAGYTADNESTRM